MDPTIETRFMMYVQDDAERWAAVHERIGAYKDFARLTIFLLSEVGVVPGDRFARHLDRMASLAEERGLHGALSAELRDLAAFAADASPDRARKTGSIGGGQMET